MQSTSALPVSDTLFLEKYKSTFHGILYWPELDEFWPNLKKQTASQWYIYDLSKSPPQAPVNEVELLSFIKHINDWLRTTHKEKFCGLVYVDDKIKPGYIKIFHPKRMGHGVCSISKECPLPGWVLSTVQPAELNPRPPQPSWWNNLSFFTNNS